MRKPIDDLTSLQVEQMSLPFQPSSRITAMLLETGTSIGASCNVFSVEDKIESIGEGANWGLSVLKFEGAPSWDLSNLRPAGSTISTKGTSSGAVSFGRIYDSIVSQMRRVEKKNGAGILGIDYRHPELWQFINEPYKNAYKMVYLPMHGTPEADMLLEDVELVASLAEAFDQYKCFLVKRPLPLADGTELFINLCTEVEIPHKGFCVLGALNLSFFTPENIHWLPNYFQLSMRKMTEYESIARRISSEIPSLACDSPANKQVGLGIYGLASMLGAWNISYDEFNDCLKYLDVNEGLRINKLCDKASEYLYDTHPCLKLVANLIKGYYKAYDIANKAELRAAFCIQPTVSTSQRSLDARGYNVSAEIQPVDGIKHEEGVSYLRKSAVKGDKVEMCHPGTWTTSEVPYQTYAETSSLFQQLMESTGLAHRHSHCYYGEKFTSDDLRDFYVGKTSHRKSLYYRLPFTNNIDSLRKDRLWQEVGDSELFDGDLDALVAGCQFVQDGDNGCAC